MSSPSQHASIAPLGLRSSSPEIALRQAVQDWARPRLDELLRRFEASGRAPWSFALWLRGEYMRQRTRP